MFNMRVIMIFAAWSLDGGTIVALVVAGTLR